MNLNEFKQEVHALAMEKGFYDPEPSDTELIAAIHSEISEAFEEWRGNAPMVWRECLDGGDIGTIDGDGHADCDNCACKPSIPGKPDEPCPMLDPEPHGIAVELIDVVLRILDTADAWDVEISEKEHHFNPDTIQEIELPELVVFLHYEASHIYRQTWFGGMYTGEHPSRIVTTILTWLRAQNIDPEALMLEKHEYNKTRPYKHGGKRC